MKKIVAFLLCIASLLLISCEANENINYMEENDVWYLLYHDDRYYKTSLFDVTDSFDTADKNDIELGWYYSFPFSTNAYSETSENPLFIYTLGSDSSLYFREDYDYQTDTFVIENTTTEILWENILDTKQKIAYISSNVSVTLRSKQNARIRAELEIVCIDNQWYVSLPNLLEVWTPSNEFLQILVDNGIIST